MLRLPCHKKILCLYFFGIMSNFRFCYPGNCVFVSFHHCRAFLLLGNKICIEYCWVKFGAIFCNRKSYKNSKQQKTCTFSFVSYCVKKVLSNTFVRQLLFLSYSVYCPFIHICQRKFVQLPLNKEPNIFRHPFYLDLCDVQLST